MPTLLVAVPLSKSWLGHHFWKAPPLMELPVELEYIPYQEFEDRFEKLNKIARPVYPTYWPNVVMVLLFAGLAATAAIGMSQKGTALSIMGQGSCFILPVIAVLWIRIRKETKGRSRKKFKHRSQKLLRAWTAQDTETHAIQWKLRLRPKAKSAGSRWRRFSTGNGSRPNPGLGDEESSHDINRDRLNDTTANDNTHLSPNHHQLQQQTSPQNSQEGHEQEQVHQTSESASQPSPVQITASPRVADVYSALRNPPNTAATTTTTAASTVIAAQASATNTATAVTDEGEANPEGAPSRSIWELWKELIMELYCCAYFYKQKRVWMIEISLRENLLDEYALPVPSPVYCDYRLPGYDDVMSGNLTPANTMVPTTTSQTASTVAAIRQGSPATRYLGSPPAYEGDSEDSDDEDGQDDDDEGDSEAESVQISTAPATRGSPEMSSVAGSSVANSIVHRPMEMTTIVIVPSKETGSSGEERARAEDRHHEVMRSMTSMTTLCASATASRATLPLGPPAVDEGKEEGQSKEQSEHS